MLDKKGMTHYEVDIKREAVRIFLEEHQTSATIAQKHVFRKRHGSKSGYGCRPHTYIRVTRCTFR